MSVSAALAAAQAAAASVPAVVANGGGNTGVATYTPQSPARRMTLDDLKNSSMQVDEFVKVKEFGMLIGSGNTLIQEIDVSIDLNAVMPHEAIKAGNPAKYWKSYDGATCATGGSWQDAVRQAQAIDPKAYTYKSADIPMTVVNPVKGPKNEVLAEAGVRLGVTLSTTNLKNFSEFLLEVEKQKLDGQTVLVKLGFEAKSNKAGNKWGVFTFTLLGEAAPDAE